MADLLQDLEQAEQQGGLLQDLQQAERGQPRVTESGQITEPTFQPPQVQQNTATSETTKAPFIPDTPLPQQADEQQQLAKSTLSQLSDEEKAQIEENINRKTEGWTGALRAGLGIAEAIPGSEIAFNALGLDQYQLTPMEWEYAKEQGANWSVPIGFGQKISINDVRELVKTLGQFSIIGGATTKLLEKTKAGQKLLTSAKIGSRFEKVGARVAKSMLDFNIHNMVAEHPEDFDKDQNFLNKIQARIENIPKASLDGSIFGIFGSAEKAIGAYGGLFSAGYITSYLQTQDHAEAFKSGTLLTAMHAVNALGLKAGMKYFDGYAKEKNIPEYLKKEITKRINEVTAQELQEATFKRPNLDQQIQRLQELGYTQDQIGQLTESQRMHALQEQIIPKEGRGDPLEPVKIRRLTPEESKEQDFLNQMGILPQPEQRELNQIRFKDDIANTAQGKLDQNRQAVIEYHRGQQTTLNDIKKSALRGLWDRSSNVKTALRKAGGNEVIREYDLKAGSSARTDNELRLLNKETFSKLSKDEKAQLDNYRLMNRIVEIEELGLGTAEQVKTVDITVPEAKAWLQAFDSNFPESSQKIKVIDRKIQNKYQQKLQELRDEGLVTEEGYTELAKQVRYQPRQFINHLNRFTEDVIGKNELSLDHKVIKRLEEGSEGALETDTHGLIQEALFRYNYAIDMNRANLELAKFARENPDNPIVSLRQAKSTTKEGRPVYPQRDPQGKKSITYYEDGIRKQMLIQNELAKEWNTSDKAMTQATATALRYASGSPIVRAFATGINPGFILTNVPRDMALGLFRSGEYSSFMPLGMAQMVRDMGSVAKDAVLRTGRYNKYMKQGGGMGFLQHQGRLLDESVVRKIPKGFKQLQQTLGYLGETSEILTRLAIRERALRNKKSERDATYEARSYLDFAIGGSFIKAADNAVPYLSASIAGTRSIFQAFRENPKVATWKATQLIGLGALGFWANHNFNREEYEAIDPKRRAISWNFPLPHSYVDDNGNRRYLYISIAKDQGQSVFTGIGETLMKKYMTGEYDGQYFQEAVENFWPITTRGFIPPSLSAILGYTFNKDFWLNEDIWRGQEVNKWAEFHTNYTPKGWRKLGEVSRDLEMKIRGTDDPLEAQGLSPARSQRFAQKLFTYNNFYTQLIGLPWKMQTWGMDQETLDEVNKPIISKIRDIPGIERVLRETYPAPSQRAEELQRQANTKQHILKNELISKMKEDKKSSLDWIRKDAPPEQRDYLMRIYKAMENKTGATQWWYDLSSITNPEARATYFYERYAPANANEKRSLLQQARARPGVVSERFMRQLNNLREQ